MPVTVSVNGRSVVHKDSGGTSIAGPDVCLTPCGPSMVPVPYVNMAQSSDMVNGAKTVFADGHPVGHEKSYFSTSKGDEAGTGKGVASGTHKGIAEFINFSFDVSVEGKGVVRAFEQMVHNNKNTPPTVLLQPPAVPAIIPETPEIPCQDTVEAQFYDVFDEPMEGFEVDIEVDGKKLGTHTMSRGQMIHVIDKEEADLALKRDGYGFEEVEE